jgi:hypothetical protein
VSIFQSVWSSYPASDPCDAKDAKGQMLFKNQCAIRMSHALKGAGVQGNCMSEPNLVIKARPQSDMPAFTWLNNKSRAKSRLRS